MMKVVLFVNENGFSLPNTTKLLSGSQAMYFKGIRDIRSDHRLLRYALYVHLAIISSVHVFEGNEPVNVIPSSLQLKIAFKIRKPMTW